MVCHSSPCGIGSGFAVWTWDEMINELNFIFLLDIMLLWHNASQSMYGCLSYTCERERVNLSKYTSASEALYQLTEVTNLGQIGCCGQEASGAQSCFHWHRHKALCRLWTVSSLKVCSLMTRDSSCNQRGKFTVRLNADSDSVHRAFH